MKGVYTALVTPFKNGKVDYEALEKLLIRQKEGKVAGLVVGGTTGEAATLTFEEKKELYGFVKKNAEGLDLIVGTGTNDTAGSVELTKMALELGIEKVLVVTPYYNKPSAKGLYRHYSAIAETGAKIVLYNVPGRTGLNVAPSCLKTLSQIESIVAVKEATGNIAQLADYLELVPDRFDFLSGDDFTIVPFISMGGKGVISVLSNVFPAETVEMVELALHSRFEQAARIQISLNRFNHSMFMETNPVPAKTALAMMGIIEEEFRSPLDAMETENREKLAEVLKDYELI